MKANELQIVKFLKSPDVQFVIPIYQRNYDWTITECREFASSKVDSSKVDSSKVDSSNVDSSKVDSSNIDSSKVDSSKVDSFKKLSAKKFSKKELFEKIRSSCENDFKTIEEIADDIGRNTTYLKNKIFPEMIDRAWIDRKAISKYYSSPPGLQGYQLIAAKQQKGLNHEEEIQIQRNR
ncbi:hypothetical protein [Algoriphagus sp. A40]|uniref:hypothetical protein n=1 Tax=Algoriphagus sp. A40 TaxID=1945863 RepID=UPI001115753C|nr:hypothetical protein [Algoriphagus sp. A40]